ncbi:MAG TPA: hypothetical protein VG122_01960 [Gemmata sp.]|nr:hypothetical protein [Gemmata sp.]
MAYALSRLRYPEIETRFRVQVLPGTVFPVLAPVPVPAWLTDLLGRSTQLRVESEKARNEFIVAPILLAVRELSGNTEGIFSGERFDVDPAAGLSGECDFILTLSHATPIIRAPAIFVVEAKRQDIAAGLGQCAAQMIAARWFDVRQGRPLARVYGCVTTGEDWQFLRLDESTITYDTTRMYRNDLGRILASFMHVVAENAAVIAA